jgi:hypothetical protein
MSADNDFLTPKLRFDKKTYPFPRAQDPVPTKIVEVLLLTRRFVPMELSWSLDLSGQLLGPLAGVVLDARAHPLAELIEPFVGEGEVALPVSGHEPLRTPVQRRAQA